MSLWRWRELCIALDLPVTSADVDVQGVSIDSRSLQPGDLFVALSGNPGPRFHSSSAGQRDGHDFLDAAVEAGATVAMVRSDRARDLPIPQLPVSDTLDGLWALGRAARDRVEGRVVAITGSAGKTTCRTWMEDLLARQAPTHASTGSLNNHWGVPLSMARMPATTHHAVFEVGTNNPGEIGLLTKLVEPDVAVVLNVLPAHIGRFPSMDDLRIEKLSLAEGLRTEGTAIVPAHLNLRGSVLEERSVVTFGFSPDADVWCEWLPSHMARIHLADQALTCHPPFRGDHRLLTLTAVFAALATQDIDLEQAARDVTHLTVPIGRGQVLSAGGWRLVDDSYNANPVSMRYAINALAGEDGHRVALLGEMLELGAEATSAHDEVLTAANDTLDQVVTVGRAWPSRGQIQLESELDDVALARLIDLIEDAAEGQRPIVLIKGANKVFWANGFVDRLKVALQSRRNHPD